MEKSVNSMTTTFESYATSSTLISAVGLPNLSASLLLDVIVNATPAKGTANWPSPESVKYAKPVIERYATENATVPTETSSWATPPPRELTLSDASHLALVVPQFPCPAAPLPVLVVSLSVPWA